MLFDTQAFPDYGKLSGRNLDDMIAGARVEVAPYKRHPADFVLWKPSKPGEPVWDSRVGRGASRLAHRMLGDDRGTVRACRSTSTAAGIDLIFPHHENEIAQGVLRHGDAGDLRAGTGCTTAS